MYQQWQVNFAPALLFCYDLTAVSTLLNVPFLSVLLLAPFLFTYFVLTSSVKSPAGTSGESSTISLAGLFSITVAHLNSPAAVTANTPCSVSAASNFRRLPVISMTEPARIVVVSPETLSVTLVMYGSVEEASTFCTETFVSASRRAVPAVTLSFTAWRLLSKPSVWLVNTPEMLNVVLIIGVLSWPPFAMMSLITSLSSFW